MTTSSNNFENLQNFDGSGTQSGMVEYAGIAWSREQLEFIRGLRNNGTSSDTTSLTNSGNSCNSLDCSAPLYPGEQQTAQPPSYANSQPPEAKEHFYKGETRLDTTLKLLDRAQQEIENGNDVAGRRDLRRALNQLHKGRLNFKAGAEELGDTQRFGDPVSEVGQGRKSLVEAAGDIRRALREDRQHDQGSSIDSIREAITGIKSGIDSLRKGFDKKFEGLTPGGGTTGGDDGADDDCETDVDEDLGDW